MRTQKSLKSTRLGMPISSQGLHDRDTINLKHPYMELVETQDRLFAFYECHAADAEVL